MKHSLLIFLAVGAFLVPAAFAGTPTISRFSLMAVDKKSPKTLISDLQKVAAIDLAKLPTRSLAVKVKANSSQEVMFSVSPTSETGKIPKDGVIRSWTPTSGSYELTAMPYNKGKLGVSKTIQLTFIDSSVTEPSPNDDPGEPPVVQPPAPPPPAPPPPPPVVSNPPPPVAPSGPLPVFAGAEGFGTLTPAGSGRHLSSAATTVFRVRSLADSGAGTLRECIDANKPRVCVFETSGRIALSNPLVIKAPYLTVAGQTAPSPGIMLTGASLRISTHDVLVQNLEIRVGDDLNGPSAAQRDGVTLNGTSGAPVYNVVLDHLSVSWAIDENLGIGANVSDVTISNSVIAEGLYNSIHPDGPHSKGILVGELAQQISIHHNLFAHNQDRNPRINPGASTEFISNVVYNWGGGNSGWNQACIADTSNTQNPVLLNFIGNYYKLGPDGRSAPPLYGSPVASGSRAYVLSNIGPNRLTDSGDEWKISSLPSANRSTAPVFPLSGIVPHAASDTFNYVLDNAGSRIGNPNEVDLRVKQEVRTGTGKLKDCISGCTSSAGGYPVRAAVIRNLTLPANPNGDDNNNGYTNLEDWLAGSF